MEKFKKFLKRFGKKNIAIVSILILSIGIAAGYFLVYKKMGRDYPLYNEAQELREDKQYSLALQKYKESINDSPTHTNSYLEAAEILSSKGKYEEAIELLKTGENIAKDPNAINNAIATNYLAQGQVEEALQYAEKTSGSNVYEIRETYAKTLFLNNLLEKGLEQAKSLPTTSNHKERYIKALMSFDDLEEAQEIALQIGANSTEDKYADLAEIIQEGTELKDNYIPTLMAMTDYAFENGDYFAAIPILDRVKSENQYYEGSYIYMAFVYLQYQLPERAIKQLDIAVKYTPDNEDIDRLYMRAYSELGQYDKALEYAGSLEKSENENIKAETLELEYEIYMEEQDYDTARQKVDQALAVNPKSYDYMLKKIDILYRQSKAQELGTYLEKILADYSFESSQEATLHAYYSWSYTEQDKQSIALEEIDLAKRYEGNNTYVQYFASLIYLENEDTNSAESAQERAIDLDQEGITTYYINNL